MAKPLTKKTKSLIAVIAVLVAAALVAVGANTAYILTARQKVSGYIRSITQVEDVQQEEYLAQYVDTEIGSLYTQITGAEKNMVYNTQDYNIYKIEAVFANNSNVKVSVQLPEVCRENTFMLLIADTASYCDVIQKSESIWTYYAFVSKDYTLRDIENYLAENGATYSAMFQSERSGGTFDLHAAYAPPEGTNA